MVAPPHSLSVRGFRQAFVGCGLLCHGQAVRLRSEDKEKRPRHVRPTRQDARASSQNRQTRSSWGLHRVQGPLQSSHRLPKSSFPTTQSDRLKNRKRSGSPQPQKAGGTFLRHKFRRRGPPTENRASDRIAPFRRVKKRMPRFPAENEPYLLCKMDFGSPAPMA